MMKKIKRFLLLLTEYTNVTDRWTDRYPQPYDSIGRAYVLHHMVIKSSPY